MRTDQNGTSTTSIGTEQYETFRRGRKEYFQYDYRHFDGELFSCVKPTLEACRAACDAWLSSRAN